MVGRVKFSVWNAEKNYWATSLCKTHRVERNRRLFESYGIQVRIGIFPMPLPVRQAA